MSKEFSSLFIALRNIILKKRYTSFFSLKSKVLFLILFVFSLNSTNLFTQPFQSGDTGIPDDYYDTMIYNLYDYVPLPGTFNWFSQNKVTPAKNQGNCGSSWAFTSVGVFESKILISGYGNYDLSEQQQVSCNTYMHGCQGGNMSSLRFWETRGPQLESCTGYSATNGTCSSDCPELGYRTTGYYTVDTYNSEDVKLSIYNDGPGYFRFDVYYDFITFWNSETEGLVYEYRTGSRQGGHAVLITGWNDDKNAWLCKNSWGQLSGPNGDGTFWIAYNGHDTNLNFGMANCKIENIFSPSPNTHFQYFRDANGDGKADLVLQFDYEGTRYWEVRLSTGSSYIYNGTWTSTVIPDVTVVGIKDVNGDDKDDLVLQYDSPGTRYWEARLSTGSSYGNNGIWASTGTPDVTVIGVKDVDGDERADLVLQYDSHGTRYWEARLSTDSSFTYSGTWTSTEIPDISVVGIEDVNGDGKADLVLQYDSYGKRYWEVRSSTGSSFTYKGTWASTGTPDVTVVGIKDVNRDKKADLVLQFDSHGKRYWEARLSTGSSFTYSGTWTNTGTPDVFVVGVEDVNGDRRADLVLQFDSHGIRYWEVRLSTGFSFYNNSLLPNAGTPFVTVVGIEDADGDGRADLVLQFDSHGTRNWETRLSTGSSFTFIGTWSSTGTPGVTVAGIN